MRVDIHFHLLPGLDDGPATMDESVELARAAVSDGSATVVTTPHVRFDHLTGVEQLPDRVRELRERLSKEGVDLSLRCGGELGHDMVGRLEQRELDTIAQGPLGARWLLLESPFAGIGPDVHAAADELRARGFGVVLAHPERSSGIGKDEGNQALRRELKRGSALQVNAWSLAGEHGPEAQRVAIDLVLAGRATALASDAHGGWRMPALTLGAARAIKAGLGETAARRLTVDNPARLLRRGLATESSRLAA